MGSYSSRARTNVAPKPLEVLPAIESWSTLDAFQATVKKDEHHELIDRSKTQKSLIHRNSFITNNYKRRTKTLNAIPANSSPTSVQQPRANKNPITLRAKTQATLSPTSSIGQEEESTDQYPPQFNRNARRPTHFYEVRQAMVNRKPLKKLESIGSMSISHSNDQNIITIPPKLNERESSNSETNSASKPAAVVSSFINMQSTPNLKTKANSETGLATKPIALLSPTSSTNIPANDPKATLSQPTETNQSEANIQDKTAVATLSAVQLEAKTQAVQSAIAPLCGTFKVDPAPHATFAPDSQPSELELKCRATVAELAFVCTEESKRKELEGILRQWEYSGKLASIEAYALSVPPSQTTTVTELANSLVNSNTGYINAAEKNEHHIQIVQAYCIYVWIANNITYDVEQWKVCQSGGECIDLMRSIEAEEVLDTRATVCTGYANLFKALALAAGLEADTVHGYVKQWKCLSEEEPNANIPFKPNRGNAHTWNTVSNYCR